MDNSVGVSNQDNLSSVDVASMGDFDSEDFDDAIGFDLDKGSVTELEWNTWDDACVWEFQYASGHVIKRHCISHGRLWISGVGCLLDWT